MHQPRGVPLVAVLLLVAAVVLAFAGSTVRAQSWAVEAGTAACPNMTYCASYAKCSLTAPNSYFKIPAGSPPYAAAVPRQLAATPIRVAANNTFQVETVKVIFSLWPADDFNFTLALFFFEANMTDQSFPTPGAALEGWGGGRTVYFQKETDTPVSPVDVNAPYYRVSATVAPFNLTAGTYFVSVATYGSLQPGSYPYRVAGSPTDGAYYPVYLGFNRSASLYPGTTQSSEYATNAWAILNTTTNVVPCLWPTGTTFRPQGSNTTNTTTTTTTGSNSTTTTTTTTTAGTTATTTGGSGGGNNPTDYLVRFSLTTELNNLSPAGFVSGVSDALELPSDAPITLVAARRAQVTTDESKRATETGTLVDFYISGSEGASLMDKALSAKLSTLRDHNVSIASAPTQIYPDASPGSLLRPSAFLLLLLQAAALLFLC